MQKEKGLGTINRMGSPCKGTLEGVCPDEQQEDHSILGKQVGSGGRLWQMLPSPS